MMNPAQPLIGFNKKKEYLICIDSDGCAFDAMEIKHKECFAPNFISYWDLQPVSKYAREVWEFVNLYSATRGCNRFKALIYALDMLGERPEAIKRGYLKRDITALRNWVSTETKLSEPVLEAAAASTGDPILALALKWSQGVNKSIAEMVHGVPPFPYVRETIEKASDYADLLVVSAATRDALTREWNEHGLAKYMNVIASQEMGTKKEHIAYAKADRYVNHKVIKLGDAIGDLEAAKANGVLFYPINPGHEEESWKLFLDEGLDRFLRNEYAGEYEEKLIAKFKSYLPENPWWK